MKYKIDVVRIRGDSITLSGWAIDESPDSKATFRVEDGKHQPIGFKHVNIHRNDVSQIYFRRVYDREFGFGIQFLHERRKDCYLLVHCEGRQAKIKCNEELTARRVSMAHRHMGKLKGLMSMETVHVAMDFWKEHDLKAFVAKSEHKLQGIDNDYDYSEQYELTKPADEELTEQREHLLDPESILSVAIPAYKTPERYFREILDSIIERTYTNRKIYVAGRGPRDKGLERVFKKYADHDRRVRYEILGSNRGISSNTDTALDIAKGDFVILADHDDAPPPDAFYEAVKAINENPDYQVIYSDEGKLDIGGKALFGPHFKPNFNPDLLASVSYICHLLVVRQDLLKQMGGFRQEFGGVQDYDFILRCTEAAKRVCHTPKALYHWRCHQNSTTSSPESKMYTSEAGSRAITAHYEYMGIPAVKAEKGMDYGIYRTTFGIQGGPLVSVIISNKDYGQDLDVCVRSLMEKSSYRDLEFVIVENNSSQKGTFAHYDEVQAEHTNFRIVTWKEGFDYSTVNDYGVSFAKGEYLLLLSNDTELIKEDSISEMLRFCRREDVGIARARLLYGGDAIQRAGAVIGFGGIAGHTFIGLHRAENSYFHRAMCAQDYNTVTAAYLMTKKSVFDQVEGLGPELAVAFNGIDYCMRVRALEKMAVYAPYSYSYHYESKSRGPENTPEKIAHLSREVAIFIRKWPDIIQNGDSCYNPNPTLRKSNFALRDLLKEKIGRPYDLKAYRRLAPGGDAKAHERP